MLLSAAKENNDGTAEIKMSEAKELIARAISIGAPAYNAGDIRECSRVYKETASTIAEMTTLPSSLKSNLQKAIDEATGENDNADAWALRTEFDAIMEYSAPFIPKTADSSKFTLEPFTKQQLPPIPLQVMDNVMGGMSQGKWVVDSGTFVGTTSLQNNGGFASLRWRFPNIQNWSYAKGLYLRVQHSKPTEQTFRIILKDLVCEQVRGANFKNIFANPNDDDEAILIPFSDFDQIEQMGRQLDGPILNPASITEIGIMAIKPTVVGEFELKVKD